MARDRAFIVSADWRLEYSKKTRKSGEESDGGPDTGRVQLPPDAAPGSRLVVVGGATGTDGETNQQSGPGA